MTNERCTLAAIPARYASSRFPGKPLAVIARKTMIQRVYERVRAAATVDEVLVATDDQRIMRVVESFGGRAVMTSNTHTTGTDRIAAAIAGLPGDLVVNVQGDEPLVPPAVIDTLVTRMRESGAEMGTVAIPFGLTDRDPSDPNAVKVVVGQDGYALYFSRASIPFVRSGGRPVDPLLHWGLYAYRRDVLERFVAWPPTRLEQCELLEQLRAMEHGVRILVIEATTPSFGVDSPEDVVRVEERLSRTGET